MTGGLRARVPAVVGALAYGFIKGQTTLTADIPIVDKLGKDISLGLIGHFANQFFFKNVWLDRLATAALTVGAVKLGAAGFDFDALATEGEGNGDGEDVDRVEGTINVPARAA